MLRPVGGLGFKAGPTHLVVQEPLLHPVVGANVLQDVPRELLVQLPCDERHTAGRGADDAGNRDQEATNVAPQLVGRHRQRHGELLQDLDGLPDLVHLDGGVDEQGHVGDGHTDDLDGVLHAQGVPHDHDLVQEAEDEECEEGGDGLVLRVGPLLVDVLVEAALVLAKDVAARRRLALRA